MLRDCIKGSTMGLLKGGGGKASVPVKSDMGTKKLSVDGNLLAQARMLCEGHETQIGLDSAGEWFRSVGLSKNPEPTATKRTPALPDSQGRDTFYAA